MYFHEPRKNLLKTKRLFSVFVDCCLKPHPQTPFIFNELMLVDDQIGIGATDGRYNG